MDLIKIIELQLDIKNMMVDQMNDSNFDAHVQLLKETAAKLTDFDEAQWQQVKKLFHFRTFAKGESFVSINDIPQSVGFVGKGIIKKQLTGSSGTIYIKDFSIEGQFAAPYVSMINNTPSEMEFIAAEDCEIITIDYKDLVELYESDMCWQRLGRKVVEQLYSANEKRELDLLLLSPLELYEKFLGNYKHLTPRLKQSEIAAFLGITPESLSRLTKRRRQKN